MIIKQTNSHSKTTRFFKCLELIIDEKEEGEDKSYDVIMNSYELITQFLISSPSIIQALEWSFLNNKLVEIFMDDETNNVEFYFDGYDES